MLAVITNRASTHHDFLKQICEIAKAKPDIIVLREKDLNTQEYFNLAKKVSCILKKEDVDLAIHTHIKIAKKLNIKSIHLTYNDFIKNNSKLSYFNNISVSIHSLDEARFVEKNGGHDLYAGHIFETNSKKNLKPRGLDFLWEIKNNIAIPVYALGGINLNNIQLVVESGCRDIAVMSALMESENPYENVLKFISHIK